MAQTKQTDDKTRGATGLRPLAFAADPNPWAEGSCRVSQGRTEVLVTATLEERLPPWRRGARAGWVTAEYAMLPRATSERGRRESAAGRPGGRTMEIQRLVGRSLRAVHNFKKMGERLLVVDADVLVADGGTRVASINGASVACALAWRALKSRGVVATDPMEQLLAAVSCARVGDALVIDPDYAQDSAANLDANLVFAEDGALIELQFGAEGQNFSRGLVDEILTLGWSAAAEIFAAQREVLARRDS
ncbi:MAG: ribonuclease PH [Alphaproteobacteria bacterium]|nr:ribonuclease PH [Alphaproteobacteria bacterium]